MLISGWLVRKEQRFVHSSNVLVAMGQLCTLVWDGLGWLVCKEERMVLPSHILVEVTLFCKLVWDSLGWLLEAMKHQGTHLSSI